MARPIMTKRMFIMLVCVGVLFGAIFLYKTFVYYAVKRSLASATQVLPVSVMKAGYSEWQSKITASGSLRAVLGVNVTTELAGLVTKIYFTPGTFVQEGTVLVQLNAATEIGQLQSLEASEELARITYIRDKAQYAVNAVSKQTLDTDFQNYRNFQGQVAQQAATVAKKTIRAPFTGRLGIRLINPGQYVNVGDSIVMLQTWDPIYADFLVPQQMLPLVSIGQPVTITLDAHPNKVFYGKVTTINPAIDNTTRNVTIEATLRNPTYELTPGAFITANVQTGKPQRYLTLPQTAITFNPYGDIVYIVQQTGKDKKGNPILIATQTFVVTGQTRGTEIAILKGLKEGDSVVTSGQLKLKNGSQVFINNSVVPENNPAPNLPNNY